MVLTFCSILIVLFLEFIILIKKKNYICSFKSIGTFTKIKIVPKNIYYTDWVFVSCVWIFDIYLILQDRKLCGRKTGFYKTYFLLCKIAAIRCVLPCLVLVNSFEFKNHYIIQSIFYLQFLIRAKITKIF